MRLNPIPWLFSPGVALAGYFYDGPAGAGQALAGWASIVTLATVWVVVRRRFWPGEPGSTTDEPRSTSGEPSSTPGR